MIANPPRPARTRHVSHSPSRRLKATDGMAEPLWHRTWASVPVRISKGPFVLPRFEKTPARAHSMPKYLGAVMCRIRGGNFGYANHSVLPSFEISNSKVGGLVLGIKYLQPKFSAGLTLAGSIHNSEGDSTRTPTVAGLRPQLRGGLRPDSYGSRASSTTSTSRRTPPGLLQESGYVTNFNYR